MSFYKDIFMQFKVDSLKLKDIHKRLLIKAVHASSAYRGIIVIPLADTTSLCARRKVL